MAAGCIWSIPWRSQARWPSTQPQELQWVLGVTSEYSHKNLQEKHPRTTSADSFGHIRAAAASVICALHPSSNAGPSHPTQDFNYLDSWRYFFSHLHISCPEVVNLQFPLINCHCIILEGCVGTDRGSWLGLPGHRLKACIYKLQRGTWYGLWITCMEVKTRACRASAGKGACRHVSGAQAWIH